MRILPIILAAAMISMSTQAVADTSEGRSLAKVAAITADALAADDDAILQRHLMTYEQWVAVTGKKEKTKSDFQKANEKAKMMVDDVWREVREAGLLVDHVDIQDVRIKQIPDTLSPRHLTAAIVVPVFEIKGAPTPMPMLALYFVQADGQWKYLWQK
jgi:hypothetical protein